MTMTINNREIITSNTPSIQNKVLRIYQEILEMFGKHICTLKGSITKIERGIVLDNGQSYYENYFASTHKEIRQRLQKQGIHCEEKESIFVIKIHTTHQEEVLLSTEKKDAKKNISSTNIIYTDDILDNIPKSITHLFYNKINELKIEEQLFRERKNKQQELKAVMN